MSGEKPGTREKIEKYQRHLVKHGWDSRKAKEKAREIYLRKERKQER